MGLQQQVAKERPASQPKTAQNRSRRWKEVWPKGLGPLAIGSRFDFADILAHPGCTVVHEQYVPPGRAISSRLCATHLFS